MREVNLAAYQPKYYSKSAYMQAINRALEEELSRLVETIDAMLSELRVETANQWLHLWERSVKLPENPNLTLEQRRSRVLARLRQLEASTPARIKAIAESYARGEVELLEDFANYVLTVQFVNRIGKPDNMEGLSAQLRTLLPAHLEVEFVYPFRTWDAVSETGKTWGEIADAGLTWDDLMNGGVL